MMPDEWKIFSLEIGSDSRILINEVTARFLNNLELNGWEPRQIAHWSQSSAGDPRGIDVYSRRKP